MKTVIIRRSAFLVLGLLLAGGAFAAPKPAKTKGFDYNGALTALEKGFAKNMPWREKYLAYEKTLAEPDFATNAQARLAVYGRERGLCPMPGWTKLKVYDPTLIDTVYPAIMPKVLDEPAYKPQQKLPFLAAQAGYLADREKYDEARALVRKAIADWKAEGGFLADCLKVLVDVEYWADRPDAAFAVVKEMEKAAAEKSYRTGYELAGRLHRDDLRDAYLDRMSFVSMSTYFTGYKPRQPGRRELDRAAAFIRDDANTPVDRFNAFLSFFLRSRDSRREELKKIVLGFADADVKNAARSPMSASFAATDWKTALDCWEFSCKVENQIPDVKKRRTIGDVRERRMYVIALDRVGRHDFAAAEAERFAAEPVTSEKDALKFRLLARLFRGEKWEDLLSASKLEAKDRSEAVRTAGRTAMTLENVEAAQQLAKDYAAFFTPKPVRTIKVAYSAEAIRGFGTWRTLYPSLEKGVCDLPFGANAEALITDVNTERVVGEPGKENAGSQMEITSVCDRYALHIYLRVQDADARRIEHGFASGISTEMYFAPGENEPYQCFGSTPVKGVGWGMNTMYENRLAKRIDFTGRIGSGFRSEVEFTDTDYVCHMQFDWDNFYQKLPKKGGYYKFEVIDWSAKGGRTWGGSRGIHHSSDWGHLVFELTDAQLREIRRELILSTYKGWRLPAPISKEKTLDVFEMWADPVVGDPGFYAACLKDLEAELSGYVKLVKPDMDDATVDLLFEKAYPKWRGIRHEIDLLRKQYLADHL